MQNIFQSFHIFHKALLALQFSCKSRLSQWHAWWHVAYLEALGYIMYISRAASVIPKRRCTKPTFPSPMSLEILIGFAFRSLTCCLPRFFGFRSYRHNHPPLWQLSHLSTAIVGLLGRCLAPWLHIFVAHIIGAARSSTRRSCNRWD